MAMTRAPPSESLVSIGATILQTGQLTLKKATTVGPSVHGSVTSPPPSTAGRVNDGALSPTLSMTPMVGEAGSTLCAHGLEEEADAAAPQVRVPAAGQAPRAGRRRPPGTVQPGNGAGGQAGELPQTAAGAHRPHPRRALGRGGGRPPAQGGPQPGPHRRRS